MEFAENENKILKFWQKNKIFEKLKEKNKGKERWSFLDGPITANNPMGVHHAWGRTYKDMFQRYKAFKGFDLRWQNGFDCQGLWVEVEVEKDLGFKTKKDIEAYGIEKFIIRCKERVLKYSKIQTEQSIRLGQWSEWDKAYFTMSDENNYAIWHFLKKCSEKGLLYKGKDVVPWCYRCGTSISQHEILTEEYKELTHKAVFVRFPVAGQEKTYFLVWTTTPWTLPGNFLLAVGAEINYSLCRGEEAGKLYIAATARLDEVFGEGKYEVIQSFMGSDFKDLNYVPLFPYYQNTPQAFRVVTAEFVAIEEGTGIVHIAPGFGDDDFRVGQKEGVELIQHVGMDGRFKAEVSDFAGLEVKPKEDVQKTDVEIIRYLAQKDLLFSKKKLLHSYPHCWRCDTPLLNYATGSWFVSVTKIKERLLELAKDINWSPNHIKDGRWGKWLEGARDWSISRQRYWASVIPIWKCECGELRVFGSVAELEEASGEKITDLHKHVVDKITLPCSCGKTMHRIPDVLDTWFDSGSMPYGQAHYPFESKQDFEDNFPAEFIGEGVDQTRAWFYYLHVIAGGVKNSLAFKNVIVNGIVLAEDGKKMSKRLQNYPDPVLLINNYGSDSLRLYLTSSPVMKAENLNFSEKEVGDIRRKVFVMWWNVLSFYLGLETTTSLEKPSQKPSYILDAWVVSRMQTVLKQVTEYVEKYDLVKSSRALMDFVDELSRWYLRLSRERLKNDETGEAQQVFGYVLYTLAQAFAPFAPFFAELAHHAMVDEFTSIHHTDWPNFDSGLQNTQLEEQMVVVQKAVELAHAARKSQGIRVRQPLSSITVKLAKDVLHSQMFEDFSSLLELELNVKTVIWEKTELEQMVVEFDWLVTPELKAEGEAREAMRTIQDLRRQAGLKMGEEATIKLVSWPASWQAEIENKTSSKLVKGEIAEVVR